MAKRAKATFFVATKDGKKQYVKDSVVPDAVAKNVGNNVYDDGAPAKKTAAAKK